MIIGIVCKCECTKEWLVKIEDPEIEDLAIINKWKCRKCKEKNKQEGS